MGEVYLAEDTSLGRKVAVKFLSSDKAADPESRRRFVHEARAQAMLSHPNIATFYEVGEEGERVFIVMEYIEGQPLSRLVSGEKLSLPEILNLAIQVGEGLQAAHEKGVVHRDIKPENVLVTPKHHAKITDFGLAKWKGATTLTVSGTRLGTAYYMSPEQVESRKLDFRTDIFSLGIILYELLCGRRPFEGDSEQAIFYELLYNQPQPLARYCRDLPEALERIVSKCLAKKPEERYQSAADLVGDLKAAKRAVEGSGPSLRVIKPTRRRRVLGIVAAAAVVLSLIVIYLLRPSKPAFSGEKSIAVLPFANMSGDPENEYFSDGITEDVITQLSKIGELKVIARSSTMSYKKSNKPVREIGKELNVATILEGSVRRAGNQVRITAQLVDAKTEGHLWADSYDKEMTQIFTIQSEIARQIAVALKAKLSPAEKERLEKIPTGNLTAYDYYLKGREHYVLYRKQDNENAIALFKKALELDSSYALAYAQLGRAYVQRVGRFGFPPSWVDSAIELGDKAVSLDPKLSDGYNTLGFAYLAKGRHRKALEFYAKLSELSPIDSAGSGLVYWHLGEFEKALRWMKKYQARYPTNPSVNTDVGSTYLVLGDDAKAEEWFNRALGLQPDYAYALNGLCRMYLVQGKYQQALEQSRKALSIEPDNFRGLGFAGHTELLLGNYSQAKQYYERANAIDSIAYLTSLGYVLWKMGQVEEARKILTRDLRRAQKQLEEGNESPGIPFDVATIYAIQGNKAEAYRWLQKAIDAGWRDYRWALIDPKLENLRNDEKFKEMMAEMKAKVDEMRKRVEEEETD